MVMLTNCKIYVNNYEITTDLFRMETPISVNMLDDTRFGADTKVNLAGLIGMDPTFEGFYDADTTSIDALIEAIDTGEDHVVSWSPDGLFGSPIKFMQALRANYRHGGRVGDQHIFTLNVKNSGQVIIPNGKILMPKTTVTDDGSYEDDIQLGAVAAGQSLYGIVHLLSGDPIVINVVSDSTDEFASATTRLSLDIPGGSTPGGYWLTPAAGPITDEYYRVEWVLDIGSTTATFLVGVAIL